jgi:hypothetical protein
MRLIFFDKVIERSMDKLKVHKGGRTSKLERKKEHEHWIVTPPKRDFKHTMHTKVNNLIDKMGYDYEPDRHNKTLKWMK